MTGDYYAGIVEGWGARTFIVHDPLRAQPNCGVSTDRPYFVFAAGWADDEPISELLHAFQDLDYDLFVTGKADRAAPTGSNIHLTGYLEDADFQQLLAGCSAMLSLTRRSETMQRGGYEALERCKPLLTSDQEILKQFFGNAAVYCDNTSAGIKNGVREIVANRSTLERMMSDLQGDVMSTQRQILHELKLFVDA